MIKCPACDHENDDKTRICDICGEPLVDLQQSRSTRTLDDTDYEEGIPKWGPARFNKSTHLVMEVLDTRQVFAFNANQIQELIIGREDPDTGDVPPVDLTASDGLDKGVSRQHAVVLLRNGALHIMDKNSANGTYLNGQRLVAEQPRILRDGDDIRLGYLTMRVSFRDQ